MRNLICVEGGDGSGKSTVAKLLVEYLKDKGVPAIYTREPGGSITAERIRKIILEDSEDVMDGLTEAYLFVASRNEHLKKTVLPALEEGTVVVMDRYFYSSLAYQGIARELGFDEVFRVNFPVISECIPELTLWLDVDYKEAKERLDSNGRHQNRLDLESEAFHHKVREGYRLCHERFPEVCRVDGSGDIEKVFDSVKNIVDGTEILSFAV